MPRIEAADGQLGRIWGRNGFQSRPKLVIDCRRDAASEYVQLAKTFPACVAASDLFARRRRDFVCLARHGKRSLGQSHRRTHVYPRCAVNACAPAAHADQRRQDSTGATLSLAGVARLGYPASVSQRAYGLEPTRVRSNLANVGVANRESRAAARCVRFD